MKRFKRKLNWRGILSIVLVGALLVGSITGLAFIFGKKTKTLSSFAFDRGSINKNGVFEASKLSIYTKEMFECQGLTITPDFEADSTYQVFYYDDMKNFIGATDIMSADDPAYEKGSTFPFAKYARVLIIPNPTDENNQKDKEFKIRFYEVLGYANDYKITVDRNQEISYREIFENYGNSPVIRCEGTYDAEANVFGEDTTGVYFTETLDVANAKTIVVKLATSTMTEKVEFNNPYYLCHMPVLYSVGIGALSGGTDHHTYKILESDSEFTYISWDVSQHSAVVLAVDIESADVLEVYIV